MCLWRVRRHSEFARRASFILGKVPIELGKGLEATCESNFGDRSIAVRCPACTADKPTYGIIGMFHVLPPALAWLWRLVAPRGHANPSIVDSEGMSSEGVGSYWPFATGRRVDQANLILDQIVATPEVDYVLIPNQHIGAWEVSFMPQWIAREYIARRNGAKFTEEQVAPSRCSLLGWSPDSIMVEARQVGSRFFRVEKQPEVGVEAYDAGAKILADFFHKELKNFDSPELNPLGKKIIECCLLLIRRHSYFLYFNAAAMKLAKSGWAALGFDLNSGWNCTPTYQGCSGISTISTRSRSGLIPAMRRPLSLRWSR